MKFVATVKKDKKGYYVVIPKRVAKKLKLKEGMKIVIMRRYKHGI